MLFQKLLKATIDIVLRETVFYFIKLENSHIFLLQDSQEMRGDVLSSHTVQILLFASYVPQQKVKLFLVLITL